MSTVGQRIREARESTGLNQSEFAREAGLDRSTVNRAESGDSTPNTRTLEKISRATGVSVEYLRSGEGPKERQKPVPGEGGNDGAQVAVPLVSVNPSAGPGQEVLREEVEKLVTMHLPATREMLGVNPRRLVMMTTKGNSMEPTLRPGERLLVALMEDGKDLWEGSIYVFRYRDVVMVKRLEAVTAEGLVFTSDNEQFPDVELPAEEEEMYQIIGQVIRVERTV